MYSKAKVKQKIKRMSSARITTLKRMEANILIVSNRGAKGTKLVKEKMPIIERNL